MSSTDATAAQPGDPGQVAPAAIPLPVPAADTARHVVGNVHDKPQPEEEARRDEGTIGTSDDGVDRDREINELARKLTRSSSKNAGSDLEKQLSRTVSRGPTDFQNPFLGVEKNSALDPEGENFSARAWVANLIGLRSRDPERYPERTAGMAFRNLSVHGFGTPTDYQKDVLNVILSVGSAFRWMAGSGKNKIQILNQFDGLIEHGEMLVVLGRPGSGCSTLLKTISGETHGLYVDDKSEINYQGISAKQMHNQFRGEAIYMAETDVHFPQLTVGETLAFAAKARAPRDNFYPGVTRNMYAEHMRDVIMATFGISHTIHTRVGNDYVRGVSGGERKRVSIAEAALSQSPLQCWDNSTRGLDSANAIEFCKTLKQSTSLAGATACVAIYQSPQSAYDLFNKVTVLYEGRQIYFGPIHDAKRFFIEMGFDCPARQTTPDFLTSLTSPAERIVRSGYEHKVPHTPDEFVKAWKDSPEYAKLIQDIEAYNKKYPIGGESYEAFATSRRAQQAKQQRVKSPYTLSISQQIMLCVERGFQRLRRDSSLTLSQTIGNTIMGLIVASVFYNLPFGTAGFYSRGALLFFAILMNAFSSALEILTLYAQRPIVEKHTRYALYHPFSEALASMLCSMPEKTLLAIVFNLIIYFMSNLRRTPGAFFVFLLFSFVTTLSMSMMFRTIAAFSRSLAQALTPAAVIILALVVYTGFVVPPTDMRPWFRWINYLNPIGYAFESLMVNEFHDREFPCSAYVPEGGPYNNVPPASHICTVVGAVAGATTVSGDAYIEQSFNYHHSHKWRNLGIILGITLFLMGTYIVGTELISAAKSKGEVLLFRRGHLPKKPNNNDLEHAQAGREEIGEELNREVTAVIQKQTAIFQWQDMCYDIKIKGETRRILDHVDGWVKPGTLTALMGPSGAGKTTLLDVLATRATIGVISGQALIDGRQRDASFQRKTGYVQQQDLHLATSTVRESLVFSAVMRQPAKFTKKERLDYVDEVIKLLDMEPYADAVVGVPGEGLNVEQRKRLTIGVELVARPELLLFLDEPTSGLDSQTSWSILDLLEKLTAHGQAILCTIHQPSAVLFQRFDRLLFLAPGGRTVYFGEIGENSTTLTRYFERNGATACPEEANPAEWMMETIGCAPGSHSEIDWPEVWNNSPERAEIRQQLDEMRHMLRREDSAVDGSKKSDFAAFAAPWHVQLWQVLKRVNQQYWRTPAYIWSKISLTTLCCLFLGFTFWKSSLSEQGLQDQMFSVFMLLILFGNVLQQMLPYFVVQRALYEARERPAKVYSWQVFMAAQILVELPWQAFVSVLMWACFYWPIGFNNNAKPTHSTSERSGLFLLFIWSFMTYTSTFGHMAIAGIEVAETAANLGNLIFSLTLIFCGVLAGPTALPGFWIFMYRVSPFNYFVTGTLATGLANNKVKCSEVEIRHFDPYPAGTTCGDYMKIYIDAAGGYVTNPDATSDCGFCSINETNTFLASINSYYDQRWRNWGIMFAYISFNICAAILFYYLARVPKKSRKAKKEEAELARSMKIKDEEEKQSSGSE